MIRRFTPAFLVAVGAALASARAATPGFINTFSTSGTSGWSGGSGESNPMSGGVDGVADGYLRVATSGPDNFGVRNSNSSFIGDWVAAGIREVRFHLNDVDADQAFSFHFLISVGTGGGTSWQYNPGFDPPSGSWQEYRVDASSSANWTRIRGTMSFEQVLRGVTSIHFRHDLAPFTADPNPIAGELGIDNVTILAGQWYQTGGGLWSETQNWVGGVPNGVGVDANFLGRISSPSTINLDVPATVGRLRFDNVNGYTISGSNTLRVQAAQGVAQVIVNGAGHRINAPLHLVSATQITGSGLLRVDDVTNDSSATIRVGLQAGNIDGTGRLNVGDANTPITLNADRIRQSALTVVAGNSVRLAPRNTPDRTSAVSSLNIAGGDTPAATLDLTSNSLVVRADADTREQTLANVTQWVRSARNAGNSGIWSGFGITTSAASDLVGLAVILNDRGGQPVRTDLNGLPVGVNDVLVKYTWNGDVDASGRVDAADYFAVDSGFLAQSTGYANGDLDYSGKIDAADYFLIDSAFLGQSTPLNAAVALPEPAALLWVAGAVILAAPTRRRRTIRS